MIALAVIANDEGINPNIIVPKTIPNIDGIINDPCLIQNITIGIPNKIAKNILPTTT